LEEEEVIDIGTLVGMSKNELVYGFWLMSATIDVFSSFPFLYKKIIH
jgi:hypothetical protein